MPWKERHYRAAITALDAAADEGRLVPNTFVKTIAINSNGGCIVHGCAWAIIAWAVAEAEHGAEYAQRELPEGCNAWAIRRVLREAGLSRREFRKLNLDGTARRFDECFAGAIGQLAHQSVATSMVKYFTKILRRIPVVDAAGNVVMAPPPPPSFWDMLVAQVREVFTPPPLGVRGA